MKTDVIVVSGQGAKRQAALNQAGKVAAYKGLPPKDALYLRLLTEEMMGMMRSLTGETEGEFWIEDQENEYRLHLRVYTRMDSGKRERLLSTASSGKNESAKGLMGRLRDFFDRGADADISSMADHMMPGMHAGPAASAPDWEWSMVRYESELSDRISQDDRQAMEALDELEKSVVAHVADDVKVSIRGRQVEMTIIKKLTV